MHAWQTLTLAVVAIGIAAIGSMRFARRAQGSLRRATLLAMISAASGLAVVHFGVAYFRYFAMSNALEYGAAFVYSAEHAWPLLFLPWSAWLLWVEVEERRLHLTSACSSMFDFCLRRLGMSEGASFRRINAARLVRKFPSLLPHLEAGRVHLSTLVLLRDHFTESNIDDLIAATSGKSKRQVEELIAARAPRPDVPTLIRKLPKLSFTAPSRAVPTPTMTPKPAQHAALIQPLAPQRYKVQLTASAKLRDKLERAQGLMRHRQPDGDLAVIVERALDLFIEKLENEKLAQTARPRKSARPTREGVVSREARRQVFARDGEQCSFVDSEGRRCPARTLLEIDHRYARALGGTGDPANLRVLCRAHNHLHAEEVFGRSYVDRRVHFRQRKSQPPHEK